MIKIGYIADLDSPSGYSEAARCTIKALYQTGQVDIKAINHKFDVSTLELDSFWQKYMPEILKMDPNDNALTRDIILWHMTPENWRPRPGARNIGLVAWETTRVNSKWVSIMNTMSEIWTFCNFAKQAFIDSGITVPIHVMGHPIDIQRFQPGLQPLNIMNIDDKVCKFISKFQWQPRKGFEELLIAYLTEFTKYDQVQLCLFCYRKDDSEAETQLIIKDIESIKQNLWLDDLPSIFLYTKLIPDPIYQHLYCSGDIFVTASRGEGFCLPVAHAMSCGMPVIAPNSTAFPDFLNDNNGYIVNYRYEPVYGLPYPYTGAQDWSRIDIRDLKLKMRNAFNDWQYNKKVFTSKGNNARRTITSQYSIEYAGKLLLDRLLNVNV